MPGRGKGRKRKNTEKENPQEKRMRETVTEPILLSMATEQEESPDGEIPDAGTSSKSYSRSSPKPSLADLRAGEQFLLTSSIAENTQLAYKNAINAFNRFRTQYNMNIDWPASVDQITLFISHCYSKGYSPSTLSTYCSGISFYHKLKCIKDPTEEFLVKKLLEGFKRSRKQVDSRQPITSSLLSTICHNLSFICTDKYEECLFKSAYTLTYHGLFRVSELVSTSSINSNQMIQYQDITVNGDTLIICLRKSKTNQRGPPTILKIKSSSNKQISA